MFSVVLYTAVAVISLIILWSLLYLAIFAIGVRYLFRAAHKLQQIDDNTFWNRRR